MLTMRSAKRPGCGRTGEIVLDLPQELVDRLHGQILLNFELRG